MSCHAAYPAILASHALTFLPSSTHQFLARVKVITNRACGTRFSCPAGKWLHAGEGPCQEGDLCSRGHSHRRRGKGIIGIGVAVFCKLLLFICDSALIFHLLAALQASSASIVRYELPDHTKQSTGRVSALCDYIERNGIHAVTVLAQQRGILTR